MHPGRIDLSNLNVLACLISPVKFSRILPTHQNIENRATHPIRALVFDAVEESSLRIFITLFECICEKREV
jgi:hypothetical protein